MPYRDGPGTLCTLASPTQPVADAGRLPRRDAITAGVSRRLPGRFRQLIATGPGRTVWELVILLLASTYFLLYGLVPAFGGDQLGLVGADEPRYAQIAREMLAAHSDDCHRVHARVIPSSLKPKALHASYECLVGGTITPVL